MNKQVCKTPPGEMSEIDVSTISLVKKGANKQKIKIYKEDEEDNINGENKGEDEATGFFKMLKSYFSKDIKKTQDMKSDNKVEPSKTFANLMAITDLTENMWRVNDTLRQVMRDIINNNEIIEKKKALLQAVDEYSEYMKNKINTSTIKKGDVFFNAEDIEIRKSGKKLSNKNLQALKQAIQTINTVINEAEEENNNIDDNKGETQLNKEEISNLMKAAITEMLNPIDKRLENIEKDDSNNDINLKEIMKSAIEEAIEPITKRLEKVENSRSLAKSQEGKEEQDINKQDNTFDGFFY